MCKIAKIKVVFVAIFGEVMSNICLGNPSFNLFLTGRLNESLVLLLFIYDLFDDLSVA
jgi:hypothetical protein